MKESKLRLLEQEDTIHMELALMLMLIVRKCQLECMVVRLIVKAILLITLQLQPFVEQRMVSIVPHLCIQAGLQAFSMVMFVSVQVCL